MIPSCIPWEVVEDIRLSIYIEEKGEDSLDQDLLPQGIHFGESVSCPMGRYEGMEKLATN